jgi:hypothetical protein
MVLGLVKEGVVPSMEILYDRIAMELWLLDLPFHVCGEALNPAIVQKHVPTTPGIIQSRRYK